MKNKQKSFIVPLVIVLAIVLVFAGVYLSVTGKSGQTEESKYLSEKETLVIAQKTVKAEFGASFKFECVDFDGIREGNFVTYTVGYKPAPGCTPDAVTGPVIVKVNLSTGASTAVLAGSGSTSVNIQDSSITILSPKKGETFQIGQVISIKWEADPKYRTISISLVPGTPEKCSAYTNNGSMATCKIWGINNVPNTGSYDWIIGSEKDINNEPARPGDYVIRMYSGERDTEVFSGYFKITTASKNSQPSIAILSPNGGETWKVGSTQNIRWDSFPSSAEVSIFLRPYPFSPSNRAYLVTKKTNNGGSYDWNVLDTEEAPGVPSAHIPAGNYTLSVCILTSTLCDTSDNYFTILD